MYGALYSPYYRVSLIVLIIDCAEWKGFETGLVPFRIENAVQSTRQSDFRAQLQKRAVHVANFSCMDSVRGQLYIVRKVKSSRRKTVVSRMPTIDVHLLLGLQYKKMGRKKTAKGSRKHHVLSECHTYHER